MKDEKDEEIRELRAMLVVLVKRVHELERKVNGHFVVKNDESWLEELQKEAKRVRIG